jgi:uncharacterized phage protein (TIGR02220 family)
MRDYGKVHTSFWASSNVRAMSEDGRALAIYLLTCPHGTIAGVFRLPDGYACEDLQWEAKRVQKAFAELRARGFAQRCETTNWVWLIKHFEWNPPENPNQKKAACKVAALVPSSCGWGPAFLCTCASILDLPASQERNPSETLAEPFRNQEQEQEQEQEKKPSSPGVAVAPSPAKKTAHKTTEDATNILAYLNERAGRNYTPVKANLSLITARLGEATVDECRAVIDAKVQEWQHDPKMCRYLRPETLFGAVKFAGYLGQLGGAGTTDVKGYL